jgi:competence protein ComEC
MKGLKKYLFTIIVLAIAAAVAYVIPETDEPVRDLGQVVFVDVGQGDCTFVRTPNGSTLLIDGGEYDAFNAELRPFLKSRGIDKVDFALATHYHSDHMGGIYELVEAGMADNLIIPDYEPENKSKSKLLKVSQRTGTRVMQVSADDKIQLGDIDVDITVLHPEKGGFSKTDENNNSLVLMLSYLGTDFLLTGDAEDDAEASVLKKFNIEADVLKVGHHGSSSSTSKNFIQAVDPTYAVIQCGEGNSYGHPHYETLDILEDNDARIYRTDTDGDISFFIDEKGIKEIKIEKNY